MLFLNPQQVSLDNLTLGHVSAIAINRKADRLAVEYSDKGPFAVFADAPEQRLTLVITRDLVEDDPLIAGGPAPGFAGELSFIAAPNASDGAARSFAVMVVVTAVEHDLSRDRRAAQKITCVAVSSDGAADPLVMMGGAR